MDRHGRRPIRGSLLWVAELRGRPVLGMPACGMFSQATTFDLVLPRLLAGDRVDNADGGRPGPRRAPVARQRLPLPTVSQERGVGASSATDVALYSDVIRERFRRPRFRGSARRARRGVRGREPAVRRPDPHRGPPARRALDRRALFRR